MGMTIDKAIEDYEDMKKGWYLIHPEILFDYTIEIMRKYQKIEQIANDKNINGDLLRMSEIRWVLKDGNK